MGRTTILPDISLSPSLISHLQKAIPQDGSRDSLLGSVIPSLLKSVAEIAKDLQNSHHVSAAGTSNTFGDDQLNVDVQAEAHIRHAITSCPAIVTASSEEDPVERPVVHTTTTTPSSSPSQHQESYTLAFDPLDGSSIIPSNWTVGAIIGLWDGPTALNVSPSTSQFLSILGVFGPRTTAIIAIRLPSLPSVCLEAAFDSLTRTWEVTRPSLSLASASPKTKYFSPANLRSASDIPQYARLISEYITDAYTLRYSGGLVPDIVHALVKGHGVYISPVSARHKAKLRRLYELCPIALVVECAGGKAVEFENGGVDILEREIKETDERGGIVCGSGEGVVEAVTKLFA
ncbi:putative Sedoheptulose-1,7-bisphosphatase [Triangularia verruculosa]|uniref:Sedoheptulose-1,7-bisphosphatase n=1 Tax=Triangularia verruculosa TaxID=2587418 RepID=A0AAN6XF18_9PEZI|nr:putative Sedoheptulose-1,7-bisphosphatase [Triangularia verruculosa]